MGIGTEEEEDEPEPPEPFEYVDEDWTKFLPQTVSVISYHKNNFDKCNKRKEKDKNELESTSHRFERSHSRLSVFRVLKKQCTV